MRRGRGFLAATSIALIAAGGLAACGDDDVAGGGGLEVTGAWARSSPAMTDAGAAYMTLSSDEAVSIVGASVDPSIAGVVELHEVVPVAESGTAESGMAESGMAESGMAEGEMAMMMQQVESIDVPAGGSVSLEPGGYHVMLLELASPLEIGEEFDVTLVLDDDAEVVVPVVVSETAP